MNTLLIGNMKRIDAFWEWLNDANEVFEISLIISRGTKWCQKNFLCPIQPLNSLETLTDEYDAIFICSNFYQKLKKYFDTIRELKRAYFIRR